MTGDGEQPWTEARVDPKATGVHDEPILGVVNVLRGMGMSEAPLIPRVAWIGFAEALVPIFSGFGCLTVAWLCVAVGLWRRP